MAVSEVASLPTPALVVDAVALAHNLDTMAGALPGGRCRPHVKAHKCTALAREQVARGHRALTAATTREVIGLARAGLGDDLLLANETVDPGRLARLAAVAAAGSARVTVAVDSEATVDVVAASGLREVLVDVDVGMPRCGCPPGDAGGLAERARARGLEVRGVMGYEGHVVGNPDRAARTSQTEVAMALLAAAHAEVGGEVVSAGGTGTFDVNVWCTEVQAGSYALMDTAYAALDLPFRIALSVEATIVSVSPKGWAVADCGLKALGMDHGNPSVDGYEVFFCSDEHVTLIPGDGIRPAVGDRVRVVPAHVDPTVAYHEVMHVADPDGRILESWPVDLRGW
ncbi:MAG: alanine racemase [Acidimicrobiia bacterium]|nr:alanine racemase [Acidimicrobiia bacterium]